MDLVFFTFHFILLLQHEKKILPSQLTIRSQWNTHALCAILMCHINLEHKGATYPTQMFLSNPPLSSKFYKCHEKYNKTRSTDLNAFPPTTACLHKSSITIFFQRLTYKHRFSFQDTHTVCFHGVG